MVPVLNLEVRHKIGCFSSSRFLIIVANVHQKSTFLLFEVVGGGVLLPLLVTTKKPVSRLQDPVPVFDTGFARDVVPAERSSERASPLRILAPTETQTSKAGGVKP